MTQQTMVSRPAAAGLAAAGGAAQAAGIGLSGALLSVAVSAVHVADQGGVTALAGPGFIGWGYRAIEVGGLLTALALLLPVLAGAVLARPVLAGRVLAGRALARLGWAAVALLGVAPLLGYLTSRTVGVPGDPGDVGNWGDLLGTASLFLESGLIVLGVSMLLALRQRAGSRPGRPADHGAG